MPSRNPQKIKGRFFWILQQYVQENSYSKYLMQTVLGINDSVEFQKFFSQYNDKLVQQLVQNYEQQLQQQQTQSFNLQQSPAHQVCISIDNQNVQYENKNGIESVDTQSKLQVNQTQLVGQEIHSLFPYPPQDNFNYNSNICHFMTYQAPPPDQFLSNMNGYLHQ